MNKVQALYETYGYPSARHYHLDPKGEIISACSVAPKNAVGIKILVAGCGIAEAIIVANANPQSLVVGIDFSQASIQKAKSIRRKYGQNNVVLAQGDILELSPTSFGTETLFDVVVCSGVLHHIPDVDKALDAIHSVVVPGGYLSGMVYHCSHPKFIYELNKVFLERNYQIDDVRAYFEASTPSEAKDWFDSHDPSPEEIADTWLHPYFRNYSRKSFQALLGDRFVLTDTDVQQYKLHFRARKD